MAWARYKNGNSIVTINIDDGTKIRETEDDNFDLEFPETLDLNIGNKCDGGCEFCYINASPNGVNADLMNVPFIDTLHHFTEVAINGNSVDHPDLIPFLKKLKERYIIANITVNQIHFERKENVIRDLVDMGLVKGIGISLRKPTVDLINKVKMYPNAVIHTINGILSADDIETLRDHDLKLLILGYKDLGRGVGYKESHDIAVRQKQRYLYDVLETLPNHFKLVSFDNLAIEQLNVKRILTPKQWNEFYMGDEGTSSMFIDLVTQKFGVSSLCKPEEMHPITDNIKDMFRIVKEEAHG